MNKKLSIITINYNNLAGLKRTIESVVNQTWQEFEYIVIDGGSTDGSAEYIQSHSEKLDYWVSEPDKGIYNAMNKGIAKASGEYLLFLNSGDHLYSATVLAENHSAIKEKDLIYFNIVYVDEKGSYAIAYPEALNFSFFYLDTLCHQSTLIKRTLFEKVGLYDENLKLVSDWKFFIVSLFKFDCTYSKVNATLSIYYLDGISADVDNKQLLNTEREQVLNTDFKGYVDVIKEFLRSDFKTLEDDLKELQKLRKIVYNLRKSKKINALVQLGLLNKF
jgi:glycosyltransferase involved in cell wall biosynthesis